MKPTFLAWVMDGWWYLSSKWESPRESCWEESDKAHKGGLGAIQEEVSRKKVDIEI